MWEHLRERYYLCGINKKHRNMKITIITKECKTKDKNATTKANLCFRLRDKDVDLKVRSDIEVMLDYWDNDALSYWKIQCKLPPKTKAILPP